jgi:hypothetical protein
MVDDQRVARPTLRAQHQGVGLHVGYVDTDMSATVTGPKSDPADVARVAIDGIEQDRYEMVVDNVSRHVQAGLAGGVAALYLQLP